MEFEVTSDSRTGKPIACRVLKMEPGSVTFEVSIVGTVTSLYAGCRMLYNRSISQNLWLVFSYWCNWQLTILTAQCLAIFQVKSEERVVGKVEVEVEAKSSRFTHPKQVFIPRGEKTSLMIK